MPFYTSPMWRIYCKVAQQLTRGMIAPCLTHALLLCSKRSNAQGYRPTIENMIESMAGPMELQSVFLHH